MPKCETCGTIVKKSEIRFDEMRSRTCCTKCSKEGPVQDTDYRIDLRFSEKGLEVSARTPSVGFEYADTWPSIGRKLRDFKTKLFDEEEPKQLGGKVVVLKNGSEG